MAEYLFPLKDRKDVCEGTMAFWFDTSSAPDFTFEPGQNADYTLVDPPETDQEGNMRTFSFAASPSHKGTIMITTRMRDTAFKRSLKTMPLGTKVKVVAPLGNMILHSDTNIPAVMLAGGIGITPFRSMIEWAAETKDQNQIHLLYSNRTLPLTAFHEDLLAWSTSNQNFHYHPILSDEQPPNWTGESGRIDMSMIKKFIPDVNAVIFYLAGPDPMVLAMRKMLIEGGIVKDHIKLEAFTGY